MSNMSYCRFENTLADLRDCVDVINETSDLGHDERDARRRLISLCRRVAEIYPDDGDYGDEKFSGEPEDE